MILTQISAVQPSPSSLEGDSVSTLGPITEIGNASPIGVLTTINTGLIGPPGPPGPPAVISSDPDNRLTNGSDAGLYVPELTTDPLAYYILAKA